MGSTFGLSKRSGRWLAKLLEGNKKSFLSRLANGLDEWFNLSYLSDRLLYEQDAIQGYLGDFHSSTHNDRESPVKHPNYKISIICRVYGLKPTYVRQFIRSVQRQSYSNWELCLCIDGDPNKNIQRYLKKLNKQNLDKYPLICHSDNRGICAATESALDLANGEIIVFADPDDRIHKDALAAVACAFSRDSEIDMVYTNNDILTPWGYRIDPVYKPAWSPELLLGCNYIQLMVAIRQSVLNKCKGLWDLSVQGAEDWDMLFQVTSKTRRIHHIPLVLYHWRAHSGSTSTNAKPWTFETKNKLQDDHISELDNRLFWEGSGNDKEPGSLSFKDNQAPLLTVLELYGSNKNRPMDNAPTSNKTYNYPGDVNVLRTTISGNIHQKAEALDNLVKSLPNTNNESLILFVCVTDEDSIPDGKLEHQAAFAILPGVCCVWPFYDHWRGIYTVCEDFLTSRLRQTGFFSNWTGNVLTGPLHGLMVSKNKLQGLGSFKSVCKTTLHNNQSEQALGALLGLTALENSLRNVAVRTVTCRWRPPVLELGPFTPEIDPYL